MAWNIQWCSTNTFVESTLEKTQSQSQPWHTAMGRNGEKCKSFPAQFYLFECVCVSVFGEWLKNFSFMVQTRCKKWSSPSWVEVVIVLFKCLCAILLFLHYAAREVMLDVCLHVVHMTWRPVILCGNTFGCEKYEFLLVSGRKATI